MATALVTGAGRNIGKAVAEDLAASGHSVALNARSAEAVQQAATEIVDKGGRAIAAAGDVSRQDDVRRIVDDIDSELGPIDILVHCAFVRVHRPFLEMSADEWQIPFNVGVNGAFHCTQAVLPGMVDRGWGRVVLIAGVTGQTGAANRASVVSAKSGLLGMTKALALEFAGSGVTVNAVSPGLIDTARGEWTSLGDQKLSTEHYRKRVKQIPVQRLGRLTELVAACRYLTSDEASFVTGQTLNVNGGMYLG